MLKKLTSFLLIPYLIAALSACGGGGGTGADDSIISSQISLARDASSFLTTAEAETSKMYDKINSVTTLDEETGNALLSYFNNVMIPSLDNAVASINQLVADEEAFVDYVTSNGGTVSTQSANAVNSKGWFIPIIGASIILGGIGLALLNFGLKTKARVKSIEDKLKQSTDGGASTAQAFSQNSQTIKQTFGDHVVDLQTFIATNNEGIGFIKDGLNRCGKFVVEVIDMAGNALGINENSHLMGIKKGEVSTSTKATGDTTGEIDEIYIGSSTNSEFNDVPLGEWDFVLYRDGRVRGVMKNVVLNSCSFPTTQTVTMPTVAEAMDGEDEEGSSGSSGTDSPVGTGELSLSVNISGFSVSFVPNLVIATNDANISGEVPVSNVPTIYAYPGSSGYSLEGFQLYFDPRQISGPGTYSLRTIDQVFVNKTGKAAVTFVSNDVTNADDGTPVVFQSTSGSVNLTSYGESNGDQLAGTFSATVSGERVTGVDSGGDDIRSTVTGTISGSFNLEIQ